MEGYIKGGQGRSSSSIYNDAVGLLWPAALAVALIALAVIREVSRG